MIPLRDQLHEFVESLNDQELILMVGLVDVLDEPLYEELGNHVTLHRLAKALGILKKREKDEEIICGICHRTSPSISDAIEEGWMPGSWFSDNEPGPGPLCLECQDKFCSDFDDRFYDGPIVRKPGEFLG